MCWIIAEILSRKNVIKYYNICITLAYVGILEITAYGYTIGNYYFG